MKNRNALFSSMLLSFLLYVTPAMALTTTEFRQSITKVINLIFLNDVAMKTALLILQAVIFGVVFILAYRSLSRQWGEETKHDPKSQVIALSVIIAWGVASLIPESFLQLIFDFTGLLAIVGGLAGGIGIIIYLNFIYFDEDTAWQHWIRAVNYIFMGILFMYLTSYTSGTAILELAEIGIPQAILNSVVWSIFNVFAYMGAFFAVIGFLFNIVMLFNLIVQGGRAGLGSAFKAEAEATKAIRDGVDSLEKAAAGISDRQLRAVIEPLRKSMKAVEKNVEELDKQIADGTVSQADLQAAIESGYIRNRGGMQKSLDNAKKALEKADKDLSYYESLVTQGKVADAGKKSQITLARQIHGNLKTAIDQFEERIAAAGDEVKRFAVQNAADIDDLKTEVASLQDQYLSKGFDELLDAAEKAAWAPAPAPAAPQTWWQRIRTPATPTTPGGPTPGQAAAALAQRQATAGGIVRDVTTHINDTLIKAENIYNNATSVGLLSSTTGAPFATYRAALEAIRNDIAAFLTRVGLSGTDPNVINTLDVAKSAWKTATGHLTRRDFRNFQKLLDKLKGA